MLKGIGYFCDILCLEPYSDLKNIFSEDDRHIKSKKKNGHLKKDNKSSVKDMHVFKMYE